MPHDCAKRRTQTEPSILRNEPMNADLTSFRPRGQKMRAEMDQDNSMAKSPPAHQIFCSSNQPTHQSLKSCGKKARNYVPAGLNCQKPGGSFSRLQICAAPSCPAGCRPVSVLTSYLKPLPPAGTPSAHGVSPEIRQTWRWRGREKAAASGQCGKRPLRSARGSCFPECP